MAEQEYIIFDFDGTLYKGDTTLAMHRFILQKYPARVFLLPVQILFFLLWVLKLISTDRFKEKYLIYLNHLSPEALKSEVQAFWQQQAERFNNEICELIPRYTQEGYICVVITASPELLVQPIVNEKLNLQCIGTRLSYQRPAYVLYGPNCKGREKVVRFEKQFGAEARIHAVYSDNASDRFLFDKATQAYHIKDGKVIQLK